MYVSPLLFEMIAEQLSNLVIFLELEHQTSIIDDIASAVYVVFLPLFILDYFKKLVFLRQALYCQLPIDTYKFTWNNDIITNIQWNHCIIINQISSSDNNISIHSIEYKVFISSLRKEISFDSFVNSFSKGKLRSNIERMISSLQDII